MLLNFKKNGPSSKKAKTLRNGFYIEIRNKNSNAVVKIRRDNKHQMLFAAKNYGRNKKGILFGEIKNGKLTNQ
jgi:hypothetical protein